jgi:hypothetical protein
VDVIFNFSRYEELRQAVLQLVRENLDPEFLYEEAEELFESWWASNASGGHWNDSLGALLGLPGVLLALPLVVVLQVFMQRVVVR